MESENNLVGHTHCLVVDKDSSEEGKKPALAVVVVANAYLRIKKASRRWRMSKRRLKRVPSTREGITCAMDRNGVSQRCCYLSYQCLPMLPS